MGGDRMRIVHTEASLGWGGQEMRILREAKGMRKKGHQVTFVTARGAQLAEKALENQFRVYTVPMEKKFLLLTVLYLLWIYLYTRVDVVNTHSSWDSWVGGITARLLFRKVVRTRHLSSTLRNDFQTKILYSTIPSGVATTCEQVAKTLRAHFNLSPERCRSIPTGVDTSIAIPNPPPLTHQPKFIIGTACIFRSWKGLMTLLKSFAMIEDKQDVVLFFIGDGPMRPHLQKEVLDLKLKDKVYFTGFLENPLPAIAALDVFCLLSTAHEGVSQALLQAAYLGKPLITTPISGSQEVCLNGKTGFVVPYDDPFTTKDALMYLKSDAQLRKKLGNAAKHLVETKFSWEQTVDDMEKMFLRALTL